ncbi:MAG: T9SS type A sorting domain-containing protein [Crocinitomix sp.]|nr:T9SS type A sorting domain-containing protein [Crocinitomix sp.]
MGFLKLIPATALLIAGFSTFGQDALWSNSFGSAMDDYGSITKIDNDDNQIIVGSFEGTIELGMAGPSSTLTSAAANFDGYVAKYDDSANLDWAIAIEASNSVRINDCAIDSDNNIHIVGGFAGTADFDPTAGVENLTASGVSQEDIFVAKYSASGALIWAKSFGNSSGDRALNIALDAAGNCFVVGQFFGNVDMDPAGPDGLISSSMADESATFLLKLNSSGDFIDANKYWYAVPLDIEIDSDDNVFIAGSSSGTTDFNLAFGTTFSVSPLSFSYGFVTKITNDFGFDWVYVVDDATGTFHAVDEITIEASGDLHASGNFQGTVDFDPSAGTSTMTADGPGNQPYNVKLGSDGSFEWVNSTVVLSGMYLDPDNNLYSAGNFRGTVDFDPGVGVENHTAPLSGSPAGFVQKMDENGDLLWVEIIQPAVTGYTIINSMSADSYDNIFVTGEFSDSVYINTSPVSEFESVGGVDSYIIKFGEACAIDNSISLAGETLTVGEAGASYQWLDCADGYAEISGETSQSFTATDNGNYSCEVTLGACVDTSACEAITTVGLDNETQFGFDVYPNPTTGIVNLKTSEFVQSSVFNARGELIMTTTENQIDLSVYSPGLYILKASTSKGVVVKKIQLK